MAVALGEEQQLGDLRAAREEFGEQFLTDRAQHRADLIRHHHVPVERTGGVAEILIEGLPALHAGEPVALDHPQPRLGLHRGALFPHGRADLIHPEGHVHLVAHRLHVGVLAHHVLLEPGIGVAVRCGGEADDRGVEILQHLAPEAVDRAVAFIHHDHIEKLRRDQRAVHHRLRTAHQGRAVAIKGRFLLQLLGKLRLALEDRIQPLDRGDHHLVHRIDAVVAQVGNVVQLMEFAAVVGRAVGLEFLQRLAAQVAPVHQKQHPPGAALADQPIQRRDRRERFAAVGGHLNQHPPAAVAHARLQVFHRPDLGGPHARPVQRLRLAHAALERVACGDPLAQRGRPVEAEHAPRRRIRLQPVGEKRFRSRALVAKRQGPDRHHQPRQGFAGVGQRLRLHAAEGAAQLLGLHHPHQLAAQEQPVVRLAAAAGQLAHRHALGRRQVHGAAVLHRPAGLLQQGIDPLAGLGLGGGLGGGFRWRGGGGQGFG